MKMHADNPPRYKPRNVCELCLRPTTLHGATCQRGYCKWCNWITEQNYTDEAFITEYFYDMSNICRKVMMSNNILDMIDELRRTKGSRRERFDS